MRLNFLDHVIHKSTTLIRITASQNANLHAIKRRAGNKFNVFQNKLAVTKAKGRLYKLL
jgi:hypothetical protein